jgi:Fe-S cluster biogenesis protein NfuA
MPEATQPFFDRVAAVLQELRPSLKADGGDIELISADEATGRVEVRMTGACRFCPSAVFTLAYGVEARLKQVLPGIKDVVSI